MRCSSPLRSASPLLALLVAALWAQVAAAQEAAPPRAVRIEVLVGYVSSQPGTIDPRAIELAHMLQRDFNLQTLRILQLRQLSLGMHQAGEVDLPTGHAVRVTPEEVTPRGLRMGVEVQDMLRTQVHVPDGNQVVIGAYSYEEGRIVIRLAPRFGGAAEGAPVGDETP